MRKKVLVALVACMTGASAFAQTAPEVKTTLAESKFFDNYYIGVNGGIGAKMTDNHSWMTNLNGNVGVRVGRNITPVFGLAVESNIYFGGQNPYESVNTGINEINTSLLGTFNIMNLFCGYKNEPRLFEVIGLYGLGWGHVFGHEKANGSINRTNSLTSKAGVDFAFNVGEKKAWQVYLEPAVIWNLNGYGYEGVEYNINRGGFQLNVGFIYKFKNSNGTHNFARVPVRDQREIDALNAQINNLREELARKPKEVVKEVVKEVQVESPVREVAVENLVFITFAQGKSALSDADKKALDVIASGKHVQIVGTASPEGSKEINDKLSQARADSVAEYLKTKGVIVDEATGKGVQGTTSNRLAVVYVK